VDTLAIGENDFACVALEHYTVKAIRAAHVSLKRALGFAIGQSARNGVIFAGGLA
jgi:hypothetical protein